MIPAFAVVVFAMLGEHPMGPGNCVHLTLEEDGKPVQHVRVELSVAARAIECRSCPGGFVIPRDTDGYDRLGVRILARGRSLDFGQLNAGKVRQASRLDIVVDTPPFIPAYWGVPKGVQEIRAIGFGDGTATAVYKIDEDADKGQRQILRHVLLRVDLLEEGGWLCLPARGKWALDSPVALFAASEDGHALFCGQERDFVRVIPTARLRALSADVLSKEPAADAGMLFTAMMQEYCAQDVADRGRCKRYSDGRHRRGSRDTKGTR